MKYLSKLLSMLLVGAMLYSTGCTDYKNDIDNLNQKVDEIQKELQEGQIDPLKADLAKTKEDLAQAQAAIDALTTKHNEDIDALKAVDSQLDGKIKEANDAILALEGALEQEVAALEAEIAALEAALAQAKQEAQDADAALKAELLEEITALETELLAKITELQGKLEGDIEALRSDMQDKIDAANEAIDEANEAIDALDLRADALEQTDETLQAEIDALEGEIATTNAELAVLRADLEQEKKDRENADAAEKAAREAAVKALEEAITALEAKLDAQVALLQAAIEALESKVDAELNLLKHRDAEFEKLLAAAQAGIESLGKQVEANYNELKGDVASLKAELKAEIEANKTAIAQNRFDINRALAAVETLNGNVAALQTSLQSTNQTLFALMSDYYSFKSEIVGRVASLEANVENLESLYAEITEELLPALEDQIAQNAALIEQTVADVQANAAALEAYKKAAAETFSLLEQADSVLWTAIAAANQTIYENKAEIANLRNELIASLSGVRAEIAASFAAVYAKFDEIALAQARQYDELLASIEAVSNLTAVNAAAINDEVAARQAADAAISDELKAFQFAYNSKVEELHKLIDTLEADLAALNAAFEAYKKEVEQKIADAIKTAVEKSMGYTDMKINSLQSYVDYKDTELSKKLDAAIDALDTAYKAADEAIRKDMVDADDKLQEQINIIVDRVQSLVFVPKYTDGKGTINFAMAGKAVVESRSQAEYQVYPAECAAAIVSAFDPEKPSLRFDPEYLETRSGLSFNIVAVKDGSEPGRILVTFEPRGLDEKFYTGETKKEYALSLVLKTEKVNLSSNYTNFVPGTPEEIRMAIYDGERKLPLYPSYSNKHEFKYNETDRSVKILPNHVLMYSIGEKLYTEAELNAAGYVLTSTRTKFAERTTVNTNIEPFKYEFDEADIYEVSVGTVDYQLINNGVHFGYRYAAGTLSVAASDYCVTTPTTADVLFADQTATWTYSKDVYVDADLFNKKDADYARRFLLDLKADVVSENLPKGEGNPSILEVLKWNPELLEVETTVKVLNGAQYEVVEDVVAEYIVNENDEVKLAFSGYEWDAKYLVEIAYTLEKTVGRTTVPFLTVKFATNIETVDRNREAVEVDYEPTTVDFVSNIKLLEGQISDKATDLYYQLKADAIDAETNYDIDEKDYLDNNLNKDKETYTSTQDFTAYGVNADEKLTRDEVIKNNGGWVASGLALNENRDAKERTIITNYYYGEFSFVPASIEFEKTFTTWYGQEFIVTKTLNFDFTKVNEMFDFQHNEYRVFENPYYSQVQPEYTWVGGDESSELIEKFDVAKVDLLEAFYVVSIDAEGNETKIDYADLYTYPNYQLVPEFVFEDKYSAGITMSDDFKISYYGSEEYVKVKGMLYVENSNGAKYTVPTSFDEDGEYADYIVRKFNPIGELIVNDIVVDIKNSQMYSTNVFDQIQLWDFRSNGRDPYRIITDGAWVVGNGVDNGFAYGKSVQDIYGIYWNWYVDKTEVPADVVVDFDKSTGVLTFKNTQQIALTKAFTVPVQLEIYNVWSVEYSQKPITVNVTFKPVPVQ